MYLGSFFPKEHFILPRHALNSKGCAREVSAITLPVQVKKLRHRAESEPGRGIASAHAIKADGKETQGKAVPVSSSVQKQSREMA